MSEATVHPMLKWWRTKYRVTSILPEETPEGRLSIIVWNEAIQSALAAAADSCTTPEPELFQALKSLKYKL